MASKQISGVPFLLGNSFKDVAKKDFRKPHSLGFKNGYAIENSKLHGIGGEQHLSEKYNNDTVESILAAVDRDPYLVYGKDKLGDYRTRQKQEAKFRPAHVVLNKVVLRFFAYFKQTVHESVEQYLLRKVHIFYYVEDDTIAVSESVVENSGIPQGLLIKRQRIPKNSFDYYTAKDFNLGVNLCFYAKTFRITSCDKFTENYMKNVEGITLNPTERDPEDPYIKTREAPARVIFTAEKTDKLQRFLEYDRHVLRFYCVWDDRDNMFGELREFVLRYFLVDDCVEVREVLKQNCGRDPFPILLRRQKLPKTFQELSDLNEMETYTWKDLKIGNFVNVLGRNFYLYNCDDYTRSFYKMNLNYSDEQLQCLHIKELHEKPEKKTIPMPPYNGFGSEEDSQGSCKHLVLKPPKKDFLKILEKQNMVLRFVLVMTHPREEDEGRRFILNYHLADDIMSIYEPPVRNSGIIGGKFMERTRLLKPGSTPDNLLHYRASDLYVGGQITAFSTGFTLTDADEYVFTYMESDTKQFPYSDHESIKKKIRLFYANQANKDLLSEKELWENVTHKLNASLLMKGGRREGKEGDWIVERKTFLDLGTELWGEVLNRHELITLARRYRWGDETSTSVNCSQLVREIANSTSKAQ